MPYSTVAELPAEQVRRYSAKQRRAFLDAFNSAHQAGKSEGSCFAAAHSAAKNAGGQRRIRVGRRR